MIWWLPELRAALDRMESFRVDLVYCAYGAQWLKPTTLWTNVAALR